MAELKMGNVTITGSIQFENIPLETYNKLIAILDGLNTPEEVEKTPVPVVKAHPTRSEKLIEFGKKLRTAREEDKLSRKELAAMIGYAPVTIGTWEIGACTPSNLAVDNLRKVFPNVDLPYLL